MASSAGRCPPRSSSSPTLSAPRWRWSARGARARESSVSPAPQSSLSAEAERAIRASARGRPGRQTRDARLRARAEIAYPPVAPTEPCCLDSSRSCSRPRLLALPQAVKLTLQTDCKCHGVSGSCSVRTCWTSLAPFRVVGDHLMARYRAAWPAVALPAPPSPHARARRHGRHPVGLRLALRGGRSGRADRGAAASARLPRRTDLVFLQGSPNYCDPDDALGSLGTAGRACNRTSGGE